MREDTRTRGVLEEAAGRRAYSARRVLPTGGLRERIAYYWLVRWELEEPYEQHALTLPAAHYVFEEDSLTRTREARAVGPWRGRFTRRLEGRGHILGIAFHPGHGAGWLRGPVHRFTERMLPLETVLGRELSAAKRSILGARDDERAVAAAERFARANLPELDDEARFAQELVERLERDRDLLRIEDLVETTGWSERKLQRLFARCVGLPPKAVIRRFRLVEAADALAKPNPPQLTTLAQRLGYFDQSHFIRDFRAAVGKAPREYERRSSDSG